MNIFNEFPEFNQMITRELRLQRVRPISSMIGSGARKARKLLGLSNDNTSNYESPGSPAQTFHMIDAIWCDVHGVFVKGWAHTLEVPVKAIRLTSGSARVQVADLLDRPDLQAFFPTINSTRCGFAIYLACRPFQPVTLEVETDRGMSEIQMTALSDEHPTNIYEPEPESPLPIFIAEMKRVAGTVVEIGSRVVGPASSLQKVLFEPECKFIGIDIHPAPGVDIVADAHFFSEHIPASSVDGVFSYAVIEHLSCPWLLAAQISKVLKPGGLTLHWAPHSFPIHETPNDFWRMSSDGLKVLFSAEMGFEVLEAGMTTPVMMMVHPNFRKEPMLEFSLHKGMAGSFVLARKKFDLPDDAVSWPLPRDISKAKSEAYPKH